MRASGVLPLLIISASVSAADLDDIPPNTWVKVLEAETGGREQPIFVYAEKIKRFVMATGMQAYGGNVPRHYDVEEFDLATRKWVNAYPPGVAQRRPDSGPLGEEYSRERARQGYNGPVLFYEDGGHLRVGAGGQWLKTKTYGPNSQADLEVPATPQEIVDFYKQVMTAKGWKPGMSMVMGNKGVLQLVGSSGQLIIKAEGQGQTSQITMALMGQ